MSTIKESRRGTFVATVTENRRLCDEHYRLRLRLEQFPPTRPGQFLQLQCRDLSPQVTSREVEWPPMGPRLTQPELTNREPFLRRPFSLGGRRELPAGGCELDILYRTIGAGTHWLTGANAGLQLSILGPLGNGFTVRDEKPLAAIVGGGVGIPPMMYQAEALVSAGRKVVAFCGSRTGKLLPLTLAGERPSAAGHPAMCAEEFTRLGIPCVIATDDGSVGAAGVVSESLRDWLNANLPEAKDLVVYACGPEPMMRAVADICLSRDYECQLALERHMACGMGTCQSCVCKIRSENESGWAFKLVCTDGPVFDARNVLW
jgi:dihydroorotate dehydrogenase electron transfer subunit